MTRLADSYIDALPLVASGPGVPDLESRLATLYQRGVAAHPGLHLGEVDFVRHLAACGAPIDGDPDRVHAEDLFLVCAALARRAAAVERLMRTQAPVIRGYLRRIDQLAPLVAEIEQRLWSQLLVGDKCVAPKLASYSGKGQVSGFVGICVKRLALNLCRRTGAQKRALAAFRAQTLAVSGDPEMAVIKERYRESFERAAREAVQLLDSRERMLLRMWIVDGHTMEGIAAVYGINQSTVSRQLERARRKVLAEVRRLLREECHISDSEFESLSRLVLSQIEISLALATTTE